ncbi:TetR/AcrR family transcriptional regulator [Arthrobacter glacialis]|uniref:TetR/AcrR family transcriptional regulator n=1 Tax=Arthrobacter glacialis TaxID=1664 RepID=A0A2S3ZW90_ARTGL|nr:TetR/AcrR family transcriptional regulator [Arthrobacter glacialis]POH58984.1 TetR/AcrR family transcriptional regulator [Arthrobacter glacialis]POH73546.1 TetR/AcrR family transcriptional regulator [Arthrobacter glacialis]
MGRTQAFDTDEAIRAARTVFWEHGYEDASLPDLERATGLSRSSIYHAFGSKRGLFDAAITSYLAEIIEPRLRPLNAQPVAPGALSEYFTGLRAALARRDSLSAGNGCLLLNAAGAPIANESAVSHAIAGYRHELNAALVRGIAAHQPSLEENARQQLATVLTSLVIAAMTLARIDNAQALATVDTALALLQG